MVDLIEVDSDPSKDVRRLRALFDECMLLLALERSRVERSKEDWLWQCRRVASALDGRDPYVTDTMARIESLPLIRPDPTAMLFDSLSRHVIAQRERRFCQMIGVLEDDGTLPLAVAVVA